MVTASAPATIHDESTHNAFISLYAVECYTIIRGLRCVTSHTRQTYCHLHNTKRWRTTQTSLKTGTLVSYFRRWSDRNCLTDLQLYIWLFILCDTLLNAVREGSLTDIIKNILLLA